MRASDATYVPTRLVEAGITVLDLPFPDGDPPPQHVLTQWLALVNQTFAVPEQKNTIAVHCLAGLGRSVRLYFSCSSLSPSHHVLFVVLWLSLLFC